MHLHETELLFSHYWCRNSTALMQKIYYYCMQEWICPAHWKTQSRSSPAVFWDLVDHMPSCLSREHYMRGQARIPSRWMLTMKSRGDRSLVAQGARIVPVFPCKHMQTEDDPAAVCMSSGPLSWSALHLQSALRCKNFTLLVRCRVQSFCLGRMQ